MDFYVLATESEIEITNTTRFIILQKTALASKAD